MLEDGVEVRGYIDKTGSMIVEPQYSTAAAFSMGLAYVQGVAGADLAYGYIDATGAVVWPAE